MLNVVPKQMLKPKTRQSKPIREAQITGRQATMSNINTTVIGERLSLPPGESNTWFLDNVPQAQVRTFTAAPINPLIDDFVEFDQRVAITQVFHILKGKAHQADGSGGTDTLQVNVTVLNLDQENEVTFNLFMAQTSE
jgi:hypothetical protein